MEKAQYAIMRFAKYKGPEIGNIEAHNERTKEKYASNPDVDTSRSKYNFHLVKPPGKYRAESERQIAAAGCRTRKDSIRMLSLHTGIYFHAGGRIQSGCSARQTAEIR